MSDDVEAQNNWSQERELDRIKAAGVVTISSDLFQKVTAFAFGLT